MTKDTAAPKAKAAAQAAEVQAEGLSVYRVFWLFLMASFLGDLIEVVFWLVTRGELISRSSLVYGPFSLVWGFGAVLLTLVFHKLQDQGNIQIFLLGTALGGVYEYICSWFQEWAFGAAPDARSCSRRAAAKAESPHAAQLSAVPDAPDIACIAPAACVASSASSACMLPLASPTGISFNSRLLWL